MIYKYVELIKHILTECEAFMYKCTLCKESIDMKKEYKIEYNDTESAEEKSNIIKKEEVKINQIDSTVISKKQPQALGARQMISKSKMIVGKDKMDDDIVINLDSQSSDDK